MGFPLGMVPLLKQLKLLKLVSFRQRKLLLGAIISASFFQPVPRGFGGPSCWQTPKS